MRTTERKRGGFRFLMRRENKKLRELERSNTVRDLSPRTFCTVVPWVILDESTLSTTILHFSPACFPEHGNNATLGPSTAPPPSCKYAVPQKKKSYTTGSFPPIALCVSMQDLFDCCKCKMYVKNFRKPSDSLWRGYRFLRISCSMSAVR